MNFLRQVVARMRGWLRSRDEQSVTLLGWMAGVSREPPAWDKDDPVDAAADEHDRQGE